MVKPLVKGIPPEPKKKKNGRVTLTRQYELITPLFGGGVEANRVDTENPIRGTAVRGHLRFWWRATRGGKFGGDLAKMKVREDKVFGTAGIGSNVSVAVIESSCGNKVNVDNLGQKLRYAAFPLIEDGGNVYKDVSFTLRIDCPKAYKWDLRAALWAWETFGGIGARTRRGFGALHCTDVELRIDDKKLGAKNWIWEYSSQNAKNKIAEYMDKFIARGNFPDDVPSLSRDPIHTHTTPAKTHVDTTWEDLIDSLKNFRQSRSLTKVRGRMQPFGRSHWPEPDAIRKLTGQSLPSHAVPVYNTPPIDTKFPRAAFGLPIVFEFQNDGLFDFDQDPRKTELKGANYERRASRLILRPLKCSDGHYAGLATILNGETIPPGGLALKNASKKNPTQPAQPAPGAEKLDPLTEASQIKAKHSRYNGNPDILQAFLDQLP